MKIVIVGGGSSYTPEIIEGLINRHDTFPVKEIVLVDIEEGFSKMEIIGLLSQRMIKEAGKPIELSWTMDRRKALEGADFVSTQIRVGGLKAREKDERIPLSHGLIGQETNGAGGIFKAFRTIPVLIELANEVHEICPNAWIINFTNPAGIVTEALLNHTPHKKVIGVCNIPHNMRHSTAEILKVDPKDVLIEFIGLNHFVYGSKVWVKGKNRIDELLTLLSDQKMNYLPANIVNLGWTKVFFEALRMLPNPYHQYYYQTQATLDKDLLAYKNNGTRAEQVQEIEKQLFEVYRNPDIVTKPKELEKRGGAYYSDVACSLMEAIYNNSHTIMTVNTWNKGAISDLPDQSVIEVNSVITSDGPMPITVGSMPNSIKGQITQMKAFEEQVIKASLTGNYHDAYLAFILNPLIREDSIAKTVLDEMLEAHADYLPQFNQ